MSCRSLTWTRKGRSWWGREPAAQPGAQVHGSLVACTGEQATGAGVAGEIAETARAAYLAKAAAR